MDFNVPEIPSINQSSTDGTVKPPEEREDTEVDFVDDPEQEGLPTELIPEPSTGEDGEKTEESDE